jgi:SAM-dependent methyltransferase
MEQQEYAKMAELEDRMWWYVALHRNLLFVLKRNFPNVRGPVLDAGCGTGGLLALLRPAFPGSQVVGLDLYREGLVCARTKSGCPVIAGSVNQLPFRDGAFMGIVSADVMYHRWAYPARMAGEALRCLKGGGIFVVQVPAFDWLRGPHDERVYTERRYTRASLTKVLREAGFHIAYCTYWNTLLFPLMILRRKVFRSRNQGSDVVAYPLAIEVIFRSVMVVERSLLRVGLRLPFGGSVLAVGVKNG